MATSEQIHALLKGHGARPLKAYITGQIEWFANLNGSGPMFLENYNEWKSAMDGDHASRDHARRHIVGWNARAIAALSDLPFDDVETVWREVQNAARAEWLATHGWRHLGEPILSINIWINEILGVIGAALTAVGIEWGVIFVIIAAVLDPILRQERSRIGAATEKYETNEGALRWYLENGLPPPRNKAGTIHPDIVKITMTLQTMKNRGSTDSQLLAWMIGQGYVERGGQFEVPEERTGDVPVEHEIGSDLVGSSGGTTPAPATSSTSSAPAASAAAAFVGLGLIAWLIWG